MIKAKSPITELIIEFLDYADNSDEIGLHLGYIGMTRSELIEFIDRWMDKKYEDSYK